MEGLDREDCIAFAIYELQQGKFPSTRQTAAAWNIPSATFDRRLKGGLSRQESHAWQKKIAPADDQMRATHGAVSKADFMSIYEICPPKGLTKHKIKSGF
jgi:hypothetical protein